MSERSVSDGGSAFPEIDTYAGYDRDMGRNYDRTYSSGGMTLRDYLAAKALQGCMAYSGPLNGNGDFHTNSSDDATAEFCYRIADAMLKARGSS